LRGLARRLIIAAFAGLAACQAKTDENEEAKGTALVTIAVAQTGTIARVVRAYGAVEFAPSGERTLAAPSDAQVAEVLAPVGTKVAPGTAVVALRPSRTATLELAKADADASAADAALARAERLRSGGLSSDADVEAARQAAANAHAAQRLASAGPAALTLRAPIAGVVETLAFAPGDVVQAGAPVAKVGSLSALRIRLGLEPWQVKQVRSGETVRLTSLSDGALSTATVLDVDPRADAQTRLAGVIVAAPPGLSPGEGMEGSIVLPGSGTGVVIPRAAVIYDQDQTYVFVAQRGVAHRRDVRLGPDDGANLQVTSGLRPGERVVVAGAASLDDGMAVREGKPAG
jgi:RND family efflux transporter MFP subunit